MIPRRQVLAGLAGAMGSMWTTRMWSAPYSSESKRLSFKIFRKGEEIGRHDLVFNRDEAGLTVAIEIELAVTFGPISLYRYRHTAMERWIGNEFISLEALTNDDGKSFAVKMSREKDGFRVTGAGGEYVAPLDAHPSTHWNRRQLDGPMINTQTGAIMRPDIVDRGPETIARADGARTRATRYSLTGDVVFDLWYDDHGAWAGLVFTGRDGTEIRYLAI